MRIRSRPKEKEKYKVRWLLLCAALHSCMQELLQRQPVQTEYSRSRRRKESRIRKVRRRM